MFILNPDPYSLPCYRIGPFTTTDVATNAALPNNNFVDEYFAARFGSGNFTYTENGRKAINLALTHYKLLKEDVVTILTTSGNFYISGCVTKEIENFCSWSREIETNTKLILVNHEFGYPFKDWDRVKKYGIPIIEDCANTFYSADADNQIGTVGDFVVYSFPKIFPIQVGGLLKSNLAEYKTVYQMSEPLLQYIKNVLSHYVGQQGLIIEKRIKNYQYLENRFRSLGFAPRFEQEPGTVPGVFMFIVNNDTLDLSRLKEHFYAHGIQCSVFYGERAFFIPCHQALENSDLEYFVVVMEAFISKIDL